MAAASATNPTLLDLAKVTDPDGSIASVVEILNETNEILDEMTWVQGNLLTGHRTTVRSGIPTPTWRKMNEFVQPGKSTTVQITNNTGMLEDWAEVDKALAELNGNTAEFRLQEDRPHIEGLSQEMAQTLFFGNEGTEPEAFTGLAPYYNSLSGSESSDNVINADDSSGAGGDNASIWLVVWGPNTIHGIVPKGSVAGLQMEDLGLVTVQGGAGTSTAGRMRAYQTHYRWDAGLVVRDWRYAVRIANIDRSRLMNTWASGAFSTGADLPDLMFQAMRLVPNLSSGRATFYMDRTIASWVARQTAAKAQASTLTQDKIAGDIRFTERYHGIPMRRCDVLAADEALLT